MTCTGAERILKLRAIELGPWPPPRQRYNRAVMTPASAEPAAHDPQAPLPQRATRCPECDAPSGAIRRWPDSPGAWRASCSRCRHAWLEASRRTLFDTLFHSGDMVLFAGLAGIAVIGSGILVYALLAPIVGSNDASAFFLTIILCLVALVFIGKRRIGS